MRQPSFNLCLGACTTLEEDALHHISEHHCCTMAHSGKEDLESGKMLYFEIILCNDYIGLVSMTWQNAALVAGGQGGVLHLGAYFFPHFGILYFFRQL